MILPLLSSVTPLLTGLQFAETLPRVSSRRQVYNIECGPTYVVNQQTDTPCSCAGGIDGTVVLLGCSMLLRLRPAQHVAPVAEGMMRSRSHLSLPWLLALVWGMARSAEEV